MQTWLVVLLLSPLAVAHIDRTANEFAIEGQDKPSLTKTVLFTADDGEQDRKKLLPEANLIVGVMSAPGDKDLRDVVRGTWAQFQSLTDPKLNTLPLEEKQKIVVRFPIGQTTSPEEERRVMLESKKYNDIIRVPVGEAYFNLTEKTVEFFKWADSSYRYKWLMKCDLDSFVRVDTLLQTLMNKPVSRLYMGKMWTGTPVDRRVDKFTPWKEHHTFAAGAGYVLSEDLVRFVVRNAPRLHMYPFEDVAVGSWLSALDINYVDHPNFHSLPEGCDRHMIVQNPAEPTVMKQTFFNTIKGIPCHAFPDPFDPKTKQVTDHVLLDLGIEPETAGDASDAMQMTASQTLVMAAPPLMEEEADDALEQQLAGNDDESLSGSLMNSNHPSQGAVLDMNRVARPTNDGIEQESFRAIARMNAPVMDINEQ